MGKEQGMAPEAQIEELLRTIIKRVEVEGKTERICYGISLCAKGCPLARPGSPNNYCHLLAKDRAAAAKKALEAKKALYALKATMDYHKALARKVLNKKEDDMAFKQITGEMDMKTKAHSILAQNGINCFSDIELFQPTGLMCSGIACVSCPCQNDQGCTRPAKERLKKCWEIVHGVIKEEIKMEMDMRTKARIILDANKIERSQDIEEFDDTRFFCPGIDCVSCPVGAPGGCPPSNRKDRLRKAWKIVYGSIPKREIPNCPCAPLGTQLQRNPNWAPEPRLSVTRAFIQAYSGKRKARRQMVLSKMTTE